MMHTIDPLRSLRGCCAGPRRIHRPTMIITALLFVLLSPQPTNGSALAADSPALEWSGYFGGSGNDEGIAITIDDAGFVIVAGWSYSSNLPTTPGAYDETANPNADGFIAKLAPDYSEIIWCTYLGGSGWDAAWAVACDQDGDIIVAGNTQSANFPTTEGACQPDFGGVQDVFVAKLSRDGSSLLWSTFLGGSLADAIDFCVKVDANDDIVLMGSTLSADFPTTSGAFDETANGGEDAFVAKLDADGAHIAWSTYLGGGDTDSGYWVDLDPLGCPIVVGTTWSEDFPTTAEALDPTYNGNRDGFVAKLSSEADALLWATFLGGSEEDGVWGIEVDDAGNPVICGASRSVDFPTTAGAYDEIHNSPGLEDATVTKLAGSSGQLSWSTFLGGADREHPHHMVLDGSGAPILGGWTMSSDFPATADGFSQSLSSPVDGWLARIDAAGSALTYSTYFGGSDDDVVNLLAMSAESEIVFTGWTESTDFPVTGGVWDTTPNGYRDAFVACFSMPLPAGLDTEDDGPTGRRLTGAPNPMRSSVDLAFHVPVAAPTSLRIWSSDGRLVRDLVSSSLQAGRHEIRWNGRNEGGKPVATGIYFVTLRVGETELVERLTLLR